MRWTAAVAFLCISTGAFARQETAVQRRGAFSIDNHLSERWMSEHVQPAGKSDDAEFLRRVSLDIVGVIPPADLVLRFINDRRADKRSLMIEELLSSPKYPEYWGELWEAILLGYDAQQQAPQGASLSLWLRNEVFAKNLPYNEMASKLVSASGSTYQDGATRYLALQLQRGGRPSDILDRTARIFLGTQIQCAQCHDHPFDRYTQEDYYANVAFFVRTGARKVKPMDPQDQEFELLDRPNGEAQMPVQGQQKPRNIPPKSLDGLVPENGENRRTAFSRIVTRPQNLQFAKAAVNRYWGHFFGRGIVHPVDEFNLKNKPSHPALLDDFAQEFVDRHYDVKWLIRTICNSNAYQMSSKKPAKGTPPESLFAYMQVRTMTPEQLFSSMLEATGIEDNYRAQERRGMNTDTMGQIVNQRRNYLRMFRRTFGDDENVDIVEFHGTIPQALTMLNGEIFNQRMQEPNGRLDLILRTRTDPKERIELIFLSALSRYPNPRERQRFGTYLAQKGNKRESYEDVMWVLLNSSEFIFIH